MCPATAGARGLPTGADCYEGVAVRLYTYIRHAGVQRDLCWCQSLAVHCCRNPTLVALPLPSSHKQGGVFCITGGEDGRICLWPLDPEDGDDGGGGGSGADLQAAELLRHQQQGHLGGRQADCHKDSSSRGGGGGGESGGVIRKQSKQLGSQQRRMPAPY